MRRAASADITGWRWVDETHLDVGGESFVSAPFADPGRGEFLVIKTPALVEQYLRLIEEERPRRIVELGTKDGGSAALLFVAADPDLLVTIDLASEPPSRLSSFVHDRGIADRLVVRCGLDQGDRAALATVMDDVSGGEPIDLVVDDASHILGPTRASFEVLFPRLRPGGKFLIEDWTSEYLTAQELARVVPRSSEGFGERLGLVRDLVHALNCPDVALPEAVVASLSASAADVLGRRAPDEGTPDATDTPAFLRLIVQIAASADLTALAGAVPTAPRPLVDLAVELTMLCAGGGGIVSGVSIDDHWIVVERGEGEVPGDFSLAASAPDYFGYLG